MTLYPAAALIRIIGVMARRLLFLAFALLVLPASARAQLRADELTRLGPDSAGLRAILERAGAADLPAELLVDKVREGLAKGVPPGRIVAVVTGLERALGQARVEAQPYAGAKPPRGLLRALVEAHAAGVRDGDTVEVMRAGGRDRAIQVLTDLVQRGYPPGPAARAVAGVARKPTVLEQLVGHAERLRGNDAVPRLEVLDALTRANAQGLGIDHAEQLLRRQERGDAEGNSGRGSDRETSGVRGPRSGGIAPPGQSKSPR